VGSGAVTTNFWYGNLKENHHLEELDVEGNITIK
jgi:hypothetical protein